MKAGKERAAGRLRGFQQNESRNEIEVRKMKK
jgi:hypothetical protein